MTSNRRFGVGAVLLVGAIGYLVYAGVQQGSSYYFTIGEFLPRKEGFGDQPVRIAGRVAAGSVEKKMTAQGAELRFRIGDFTGEAATAEDTLLVEYTGVLPDMFAEGRDVIVEGKYSGGTLRAHSVMTSCPSKYEPKPGDKAGEAAAKGYARP